MAHQRQPDYAELGRLLGRVGEQVALHREPNIDPARFDQLEAVFGDMQRGIAELLPLREAVEGMRQAVFDVQGNIVELRHGQDDLQRTVGALQNTVEGLQNQQAEVFGELQRVDSLARSRSHNSSAGVSDILAFPLGINGDAPHQLRARTVVQLSRLNRRQLQPYIDFYGVVGRNRDEELFNLLSYLGCRSAQEN
eukprot:CAMPEP_0177597382 /NCGR_PEP_ID=MMETSP0419_2-20121207/11676_1 /TAXON_ID=582737 /ORGANISM="Tetraselmis sp., Strain GSL018" /LENGTH=194 /DNA_ID=CAMNT_0019089537 /DNA_START=156 /DNA_END=740 /DNA_ORIENTATION=-